MKLEEQKKLLWKEERRKDGEGEETIDARGDFETPCTVSAQTKWQLTKGNPTESGSVLSIYKPQTLEVQNNTMELRESPPRKKLNNVERELEQMV